MVFFTTRRLSKPPSQMRLIFNMSLDEYQYENSRILSDWVYYIAKQQTIYVSVLSRTTYHYRRQSYALNHYSTMNGMCHASVRRTVFGAVNCYFCCELA